MFTFMASTRSLSDENRIRALMALDGHELCVCQIIDLLGLAPSTVSKHMQILTQARLVKNRKEGRWRYYRLAGDNAPEEVRRAIDWVCGSVSNAPRICKDAEILEEMLKIGPEELCRVQSSAF